MINFLKNSKAIIGMIHVDALPGTPKFSGNIRDVVAKAVAEAKLYQSAGVDILAIENMHDVPYLNRKVGAEIVSAMTIVGYEVKNATQLKCGIQILAGANFDALAVAQSAGLDFIRAEGFVFAHTADEGIIQADAGELLRYRRKIGANDILVLTDIKKKHSAHNLTADVDIIETAHAAEFFLSDGVIVTGVATGSPTNPVEVERVKNSVKIPVLVGSGVTQDNVANYLGIADALIVGSYFKEDGYWSNAIDLKRVESFMKIVHRLR